jgi:hypothetical protein
MSRVTNVPAPRTAAEGVTLVAPVPPAARPRVFRLRSAELTTEER